MIDYHIKLMKKKLKWSIFFKIFVLFTFFEMLKYIKSMDFVEHSDNDNNCESFDLSVDKSFGIAERYHHLVTSSVE
jgi:hypothetical protein